MKLRDCADFEVFRYDKGSDNMERVKLPKKL